MLNIRRSYPLNAAAALTLSALPMAVLSAQSAACRGPTLARPFAPELSDSGRLFRGVLTRTGDELYYFKRVSPSGEEYRIFRSLQRGGEWSSPETVVIGAIGVSDLYPTVSNDGRELVFSSYRPLSGADASIHNAHLWHARRADESVD